MQLEQIEVKGLSHYSYIVYSGKKAAVIDPKRDIDTYLDFLKEKGLHLLYIFETHIHADYASGARELAKETGAAILESGYDKGEQFEIQFDHKDIFEGDIFELGAIQLKIMHTPGHTPEHISIQVLEDEKPVSMFTGDFLFIGSVGRPDLLGEGETKDLARKLYQSIKKLNNLPGDLKIYPAHGAGSLCGAGMSTDSSHSTLAAERISNAYLDSSLSEEEFIGKLLGTTPPFPEYYKRMKGVNSDGPSILGILPELLPVKASEVRELIESDFMLLDTRHPLAFGGGHIPGSINIHGNSLISTWAPWLVPYDKPVYLVTDGKEAVEAALRALIQVGLDEVKGYIDNINGYIHSGEDFAELDQVSVHELNNKLESNNITVLDVRGESEWNGGHIKGAKHLYLGYVPEKLNELSKDAPVYTVCGGGFRSSVAGSILEKEGFKNVHNVFGGMSAWKSAGF